MHLSSGNYGNIFAKNYEVEIMGSQLISESVSQMCGMSTSTAERALNLLGAGVSAVQVAQSCGVSESRISQLMSQSEFSEAVQVLRFARLQKQNLRDDEWDSLEDSAVERLKKRIESGMIHDDNKLLRIAQIANAAKRRGVASPDSNTGAQSAIVQLVMPVQIVNKFTKDSHNRVVEAGDQSLVTIQSGSMSRLLSSRSEPQKGISEIIEENHEQGNSRSIEQVASRESS